MNVMLLVVGVIFAISIFIGYKKGFISIAASCLAAVIIGVLVMSLSPYVSKWIRESTPLVETVQRKCLEVLGENLQGAELTDKQQSEVIEGAGFPEIISQKLIDDNNYEIYDLLGVTTFGEYVGAYLAKIIADILAFLLTLVVVTLAVRVIIGMLGIIGKLPIIGGLNHLAGAVLGIGIGLAFVWILFIIITLLYSTSIGASCLDNILNNQFLTWLYNNNILMKNIISF